MAQVASDDSSRRALTGIMGGLRFKRSGRAMTRRQWACGRIIAEDSYFIIADALNRDPEARPEARIMAGDAPVEGIIVAQAGIAVLTASADEMPVTLEVHDVAQSPPDSNAPTIETSHLVSLSNINRQVAAAVWLPHRGQWSVTVHEDLIDGEPGWIVRVWPATTVPDPQTDDVEARLRHGRPDPRRRLPPAQF